MLTPVKTAFGDYLAGFYAGIVPTTKAMETYVTRGLAKSIVWAPARMVDSAEDMLSSWQRNDTDGAPSHPAAMPVILVAMSKDYVPAMRDYTKQVAERVLTTIPGDVKDRVFGLRAMAGDIRAQLAIFSNDEQTARSIAGQFLLFLDSVSARRFTASYAFAGQVMQWPVQIESPDSPAMSIQTDAKNLTILAIDITLKVEIPLYDAPAIGQPNDGKGTPGSLTDPAGYPTLQEVRPTSRESGDDKGSAHIRHYIVNKDRNL